MPLSIEAISPERAFVVVSHMITFIVNAFERVRA